MKYKYFNLEKFSVESIVDELYDFSKVGAISIPGVLSKNAREDLVKGAKSAKNLFWKAPRVEGPVIQEMEALYLENLDIEDLEKGFIDSIEQFKEEYGIVYRQIAERSGFEKKSFNSIGIHNYPENSQGITPHRDYAKDKDLISIFVLSGNAKFGVCKNREKNGSVELESTPGSLILLRAARNDSEQKYRPFHYVEPIREERFSLISRRRLK